MLCCVMATILYSLPCTVAMSPTPRTAVAAAGQLISRKAPTGSDRGNPASAIGCPSFGGIQAALRGLKPSNHRPPCCSSRMSWACSCARAAVEDRGSLRRSSISRHNTPSPSCSCEHKPWKAATTCAYSRMPCTNFSPSPFCEPPSARSLCKGAPSSSRLDHGFAPLKWSTFKSSKAVSAPLSEKCASRCWENRMVPLPASRCSYSS
mmetsp:Transcript_46444/g.89602  ORF Transcript_46444/g.89602 Transcript_46444/m.89602 type:complete len:207 (+) Transcript_46444:801-1421(+)